MMTYRLIGGPYDNGTEDPPWDSRADETEEFMVSVGGFPGMAYLPATSGSGEAVMIWRKRSLVVPVNQSIDPFTQFMSGE